MNKQSNDYDRPFVYPTPADGTKEKRYPNSIAVLAATILQALPGLLGKNPKGRFGTKTDFRQTMHSEIADTDEKLRKRYTGSGSHKKDVARDLHEIATSSPSNLNYMQLRRMAELLDMPLGMLLIFTNLVSQERRIKKAIGAGELPKDRRNQELLKLVSKLEVYSAELRTRIESSELDQPIFVETFKQHELQPGKGRSLRPGKDTEEAYLTNLEELVRLSRVCKLGESRLGSNEEG